MNPKRGFPAEPVEETARIAAVLNDLRRNRRIYDYVPVTN